MTALATIIVVLAVITAFGFGWVSGENAAKWDYIVESWEDEEDPEDDGAEELDSGSDR